MLAREEGLIFLGNGNGNSDGLHAPCAGTQSFSAVAESLEMSEWMFWVYAAQRLL